MIKCRIDILKMFYRFFDNVPWILYEYLKCSKEEQSLYKQSGYPQDVLEYPMGIFSIFCTEKNGYSN